VNNKSKWAEHDATELIKKYKGPKPDILIDVGTADNFYKQGQLLPEHLQEAAKAVGLEDSVTVRYQEV
jgi:S-formylglutathione hydrolase